MGYRGSVVDVRDKGRVMDVWDRGKLPVDLAPNITKISLTLPEKEGTVPSKHAAGFLHVFI